MPLGINRKGNDQYEKIISFIKEMYERQETFTGKEAVGATKLPDSIVLTYLKRQCEKGNLKREKRAGKVFNYSVVRIPKAYVSKGEAADSVWRLLQKLSVPYEEKMIRIGVNLKRKKHTRLPSNAIHGVIQRLFKIGVVTRTRKNIPGAKWRYVLNPSFQGKVRPVLSSRSINRT